MKAVIYLSFLILILSGCRDENLVEDELPTDVTLGASLSIISPVDADEFSYGEEVLIKWTPANARVNIELYKKTDYKLNIASDVNTSGEYVWVVPDQMEASLHYRIKLILHSNPDNSIYSEEFTIKGF